MTLKKLRVLIDCVEQYDKLIKFADELGIKYSKEAYYHTDFSVYTSTNVVLSFNLRDNRFYRHICADPWPLGVKEEIKTIDIFGVLDK